MGFSSARARGELHVDAELRVVAGIHERDLREHERRGPGLELRDRKVGQADRGRQLRDALVFFRADHVGQSLRAGERAVRGDELHGLQGIQVVEIDFHDQRVGGLVGTLELRGEFGVFPGERMHRSCEVHGIALALDGPDRGAAVRGRESTQ